MVEGAYGAGLAGGSCDPRTFFRKPEVLLRLASLVFAIIVFGCISSQGYLQLPAYAVCAYNGDGNACNYGIGIGVLAFLLCIAFLAADAMFGQVSSVQHRRYIVIGDMALSGLWAFLWFVGFCYLTNAWAKTERPELSLFSGTSGVQAAIAFSFFSFASFTALTVLAVIRFRKGVADATGTAGGYEPSDVTQSSNPYASFGEGSMDQSYKPAPFSGGPASTTGSAAQPPLGTYQPPTY